MPEPTKPNTTQPNMRRIVAGIVAALITSIFLIYCCLIVSGAIPPQNRLKLEEVGLALILCFFIVLLVYPEKIGDRPRLFLVEPTPTSGRN